MWGPVTIAWKLSSAVRACQSHPPRMTECGQCLVNRARTSYLNGVFAIEQKRHGSMRLPRNKALLPAVAIVIAAGIGGLVYFQNAGGDGPIAGAVGGDRLATAKVMETAGTAEGSALITPRVLGDPNAPVTIIEYTSLTCPHCAAFHGKTLPRLERRYIDTGKAKLVVRDFPLDERAAVAALLARCAPEDRYFPLVNMLFAQQRRWVGSDDVLGALARLGGFAGMSSEAIDQCFENQELYAAIVDQSEVWQEEHDIHSTPTFIINGQPVIGDKPFEEFRTVIDSKLR